MYNIFLRRISTIVIFSLCLLYWMNKDVYSCKKRYKDFPSCTSNCAVIYFYFYFLVVLFNAIYYVIRKVSIIKRKFVEVYLFYQIWMQYSTSLSRTGCLCDSEYILISQLFRWILLCKHIDLQSTFTYNIHYGICTLLWELI